MKKKLCILSLILIFCLNQCTYDNATIQPIERSVKKLKISIDPRIELLSTIQLMSDYHIVNKDAPYSKSIKEHFKSFSSHEAVRLTDSLNQKYGFSYDAPLAAMMHLSALPELEVKIDFSDYLLRRSGRGDHLEQYRKSIKQFSEASSFEAFWNSERPFYNQILDLIVADMNERDLVKALEEYFNESQESYNIVVLPLYFGGFAALTPGTNEKKNVYAFLPTLDIKDGTPYIRANTLVAYAWHEFGHSFVNPLCDKYADKIALTDKLYEPIEETMRRQAYDQWISCVGEHIVRAATIRLYDLQKNTLAVEELLAMELNNGFIYIEPIIEKLKEYENQKEETNITFTEFFTELLTVFDDLLK